MTAALRPGQVVYLERHGRTRVATVVAVEPRRAILNTGETLGLQRFQIRGAKQGTTDAGWSVYDTQAALSDDLAIWQSDLSGESDVDV